MKTIQSILTFALICCMTSVAANENSGSSGLQYSLSSVYETDLSESGTVTWLGGYGQPETDYAYSEVSLIDEPLIFVESASELGLGTGVAPLFTEHGVLRASGNLPESTYLALGFVVDEATIDETEWPDSLEVIELSYGIGVSKSAYDVEYMLSVDEEGRGVSAVGLGITSRF